jgi:hypothetical protein
MAAPTVNITVLQRSTQLPYQVVTLTPSIAKTRNIETGTFKWTASASGTNEYYLELLAGGNPASALTSGTIRKAYAMFVDQATSKFGHAREQTIGSLDVYGFGFGDNDSLGYNTFYYRAGESDETDNDPARAPANKEFIAVWDESLTGDGSEWEEATIEWWFDLDDAGTASALTGYGTGDLTQFLRYVTDPRTGETVDILGSAPTSTQGSPVQGNSLHVALPEGTFRIGCRVTNASREQTTVFTSVTVNAETETVATVNSAGGADYTTWAAARAAGETLIELEGGHSETFSVNTATTTSDVRTYWNGTGTKPVFINSGSNRFDIIAEGVSFIGIRRVANASVAWPAFRIAASAGASSKYNLVAGCDIDQGTGMFDGCVTFENLSTTAARRIEGSVAFGCTGEEVGEYSVQVANDPNPVYACGRVGCDFGPSATESVDRTTGMQTGCTTLYCEYDEDSKENIRQAYGGWNTVYGCKITGANRHGETGEVYHKTVHSRWDSCLLLYPTTPAGGLSAIGFKPGNDGILYANCIVENDTTTACLTGSGSPGLDTDPFVGYQNQSNIKILCCTFEMTTDLVVAIEPNGATDDDHINDNVVQACLFALQSSYTPTANTLNNKWTYTDNQNVVGVLDSDKQVTGTTATTTPSGVYLDYNGYVRDTTSLRGAAIEAPIGGSMYDGSLGWFIETVTPITDPADANWGQQYSSGDGSAASPFGSVKELLASGLMVDGQTIYIDQPTGIPCYGSHQIDESNITIRPGGETSRARWVNGYPIDVPTLVSSHATNDIYRCATGALGTGPTEVSRNWNTSTNANGNRYGIMDETTLVGLQTTTGWFYDSGTDTLYVSIPTGDDIDDYEFIVGLAGDTLRMTNPLASTVEYQSYEHALQAGNGVGYGLRLLGNTQGFPTATTSTTDASTTTSAPSAPHPRPHLLRQPLSHGQGWQRLTGRGLLGLGRGGYQQLPVPRRDVPH